VLYLDRADFARGKLQGVEGRWQRMVDHLCPGGPRADDEMRPGFAYAVEFHEAVDVEDVFTKRPCTEGGIEVGAARQNTPGVLLQQVKRLLDRAGFRVTDHRAYPGC